MPFNSPDDALCVHWTLDLKAGGPLRDATPGGRMIVILHIPEFVIGLQETPVTFHPHALCHSWNGQLASRQHSCAEAGDSLVSFAYDP